MISRRLTPNVDKEWARRLLDGVNARDRFKNAWDNGKSLLIGGYGRSKKGKLTSKIGWSAFQTMIGTVFAQIPRPVIRETGPALAETAKMLTARVAHALDDELPTRYVTRMAAMDVMWAGFGIVMMTLDQTIGEDGTPRNQKYGLRRVHPQAIVPDPKGWDPDMVSHNWSAVEIYPTVRELKRDPRYKISKSVLDKLQDIYLAPQSPGEKPKNSGGWDQGAPGKDDADEFRRIRCYEIYDKANARRLYMPADSNEIIGEEDWPVEPRFRGDLIFPWVTLYFNENPDEFWPIPEMSVISEDIEALSALERQILLDAVNKMRRYVVRGDLLAKGHMDQLKKGGPVEVMTVLASQFGGDPNKIDLGQIVREIPDPTVKNDVVGAAEYQKQKIHEAVGAGDFAQGGFRSTRSATEAAALSDFLRTRVTTRTENIDAYFKKLVRMYVLFFQETAVEPKSVQTVDSEGQQVWGEISKENAKGDFVFSIIAGSSMPKNSDSVRERNMAFFQQAAPVIQQNGGDLRAMFEWIAPYYDMPDHVVDRLFANHKAALQNLAGAIIAGHMSKPGEKPLVTGDQLLEAASAAVSTGLNSQELQGIHQKAAAVAQQAQRQPVSLPGTNTSKQTL